MGLFDFGKRPEFSQTDCDNLKALGYIMSKMDERGFERSMKEIGAILPHRGQQYEAMMKQLVEENYKKGVPGDIIVQKIIPEFQFNYRSGYLTSEIADLARKCREYKAQTGGKAKKRTKPKKKTTMKKRTTAKRRTKAKRK